MSYKKIEHLKKLILLVLLPFLSFAQRLTLSEEASISLLTISPGAELYSTFGHTAIRIQDLPNGLDKNYNYGTFDFSTEGFYLKFLRGTLPYQISAHDFNLEYRYWTAYEGRGIIQQVLLLDSLQKQKVYDLLETNLQPENSSYAYKFFYDNCSTRIRDVIEKACGNSLSFNQSVHADSTFRQWIDLYAHDNQKSWSDFGMDIAIGIPSDEVTGWYRAMFLPDNLMDAFQAATMNGRPLVQRKTVIAPRVSLPEQNKFTPFFFFSMLFILTLLLSGYEVRKNWNLRWFDGVLFGILSLLGSVMLLLWFGTDHGVTTLNMNIVWCLPLLGMAYWKNWKRVFAVQSVLIIILFLGWKFWPQSFNPSVLPIAGIVLIRSFVLWRRK